MDGKYSRLRTSKGHVLCYTPLAKCPLPLIEQNLAVTRNPPSTPTWNDFKSTFYPVSKVWVAFWSCLACWSTRCMNQPSQSVPTSPLNSTSWMSARCISWDFQWSKWSQQKQLRFSGKNWGFMHDFSAMLLNEQSIGYFNWVVDS